MMTITTKSKIPPLSDTQVFARILRNGLIIIIGMAVIAVLLQSIFKPLIARVKVEETVTMTLSQLLVLLVPYITYITSGSTVRDYVKLKPRQAIVLAIIGTVILYAIVTAGQYFFHIGPFAQASSVEMTFGTVEDGVIVESVVPGGAGDVAGMQVGDVITAIRRDPVDRSLLVQTISRSEPDTPLRLRFLRDGEEQQLTVRTVLSANVNISALMSGLVVAVLITVGAIFWPGNWTPYVLLSVILAPLLLGYLWLLIATFSYRTQGLIPLDGQNNIGGFTIQNWDFLFGQDIVGLNVNIWQITLNSHDRLHAQAAFVHACEEAIDAEVPCPFLGEHHFNYPAPIDRLRAALLSPSCRADLASDASPLPVSMRSLAGP
jgi:hypothetical protein